MVKLKQILFLEIFVLILFEAVNFVYCNNIRDPFYLAQSNNNDTKSEIFTLFGIIQSASKSCAIIAVSGVEESVFEGDKIAGFKVFKIGDNSVTLTKGKILKILKVE